jgi:hypothetical protein
MTEANLEQIEERRTCACDNDVFSTDFVSKMDKRFRSVPVQSCEESWIESDASFDPPDAGTAVRPPVEVTCTPLQVTTGSSTPLQVPTPEIAEPADAPMVS